MPKSHTIIDSPFLVFQEIMRTGGTLKTHCTEATCSSITGYPRALTNIYMFWEQKVQSLVLHNLAVPAFYNRENAEKFTEVAYPLNKVKLSYQNS